MTTPSKIASPSPPGSTLAEIAEQDPETAAYFRGHNDATREGLIALGEVISQRQALAGQLRATQVDLQRVTTERDEARATIRAVAGSGGPLGARG